MPCISTAAASRSEPLHGMQPIVPGCLDTAVGVISWHRERELMPPRDWLGSPIACPMAKVHEPDLNKNGHVLFSEDPFRAGEPLSRFRGYFQCGTRTRLALRRKLSATSFTWQNFRRFYFPTPFSSQCRTANVLPRNKVIISRHDGVVCTLT